MIEPETIISIVQIIVVLLLGFFGNKKVKKLDVKVNGRLEEFLKSTASQGYAEGHESGIEQERVRKEVHDAHETQE